VPVNQNTNERVKSNYQTFNEEDSMKQPPQTQMYDGGQMNENELQSRVEIYDDNKMNINT